MEQEGREVLRTLIRHGYEAFFVGGYVRDLQAGRQIQDIDIATSALPEQVMRMFPRTVPTGLQHGTVMVLGETGAFEVTTFRKEAEYEDHRRPKRVEFVSDLNEDLRRRDFTINAMALSADGKLIDPFGGAADLRDRVLRCVGDPQERFREDALRMLRCLRFAAEYELVVEPETWTALRKNTALMKHIALERVRSELEKMVAGRFPDRGLELLLDSGLLHHLKRDFRWPLKDWTALPGFLCEALHETKENVNRWALLFIAMNWPAQQTKSDLLRLTFSRKQAEAIAAIVAFHQWLAGDRPEGYRLPEERPLPQKASIEMRSETDADGKTHFKRGILKFGEEAARRWMELPIERISPATATFRQSGRSWLEELPAKRIADLRIDGNDLLSRFVSVSGPWIGQCLNRLLKDVALHGLPNRKETLLARADVYFNNRENDGE